MVLVNEKTHMRYKTRLMLPILIILLAGLVSIFWFRGKYLITATDLFFPINRLYFFKLTLSSWDPRSFGSNNFRMLAGSIPFGLYLAITDLFHISLINTQKIIMYIQLAGSGLSMFYLIYTISQLTKKNSSFIQPLIGGLMYMFNPFLAIMITSFPFMWQPYITLPLLLALYVKGVTENKGFKYIFVYCLIWLISTTNQYINPKYLIFDLLPLFLFFLYYFFILSKDTTKKKQSVYFSIKLLVLLLLLYSYWLIPAFFGIKQNFKDVAAAYQQLGQRDRMSDYILNSAKNVLDSLRLWGLWAIKSGYKGEPYFFWTSLYDTPLYIIIGYLASVVILIPFVLDKLKHRFELFFLCILILSVIGMSGSAPGFNTINLKLAKIVPLYTDIFSIPYVHFGIFAALAYVFLFSYGIKYLYQLLRPFRIFQILFIFLVFVVYIGIYPWPVWTGNIFRPQKPIIASNRYAIPSYYYQMSNFLKNQRLDYKIYSLPYSRSGYGVYTWDMGFNGPDISYQFLGNILYGINPVGLAANQSIINGQTKDLSRQLSLLNTKYILLHNDANWQFLNDNSWWSITSQKQFKDNLSKQEDIKFDRSFGKLDLYKLNKKSFLAHLYTPVSIHSPTIEYKKINPFKYIVFIHGSSEKFPLVFSETFNDGWKIYVTKFRNSKIKIRNLNTYNYKILNGNRDDQANLSELRDYINNGWVSSLGDLKYVDFISKNFNGTIQNDNLPNGTFYDIFFANSIQNTKHMLINRYANSWQIDPQKICNNIDYCKKNNNGSYDMQFIVEFWPQYLFYIGLLISGITLFGCFSYIIFQCIRPKR